MYDASECLAVCAQRLERETERSADQGRCGAAGRRGGAPAGGAPRARPVIERVSGGSWSAARSARSTRCASLSGRSVPSRPSANARGGAIDAVRGWCAGLGRGVKRLTSAIVHASSAASEVRDVELAHTGHRRRSGAVGVEAGRPRRAPRISARCISRRCGAAAGPALGETSPCASPNVRAPTVYPATLFLRQKSEEVQKRETADYN